MSFRGALDERTEAIAGQVVDAALKVHKALGPGLLESVYEACLCHEFGTRGLGFERQKALPIVYDGVTLPDVLRLDLVVEDQVIVEVKAVERLLPVFDAQLLTYLKLADMRLGLLMNLNVAVLRDGIRRLVR
jgi:GxxExxY protein